MTRTVILIRVSDRGVFQAFLLRGQSVLAHVCTEMEEGIWALTVLVLREFQMVLLENTEESQARSELKAFF